MVTWVAIVFELGTLRKIAEEFQLYSLTYNFSMICYYGATAVSTSAAATKIVKVIMRPSS